MNRRNFAFLGLGSLLVGCTKKPKHDLEIQIQTISPRAEELERFELEIAKTLGDKMKERNWKLEECSSNWFHGIPNLQGTKLCWNKCEKGYYFFINKYELNKLEKITHTGTPKVWTPPIDGIDTKERIYSKLYQLSDDEASQLYINLAIAFKV